MSKTENNKVISIGRLLAEYKKGNILVMTEQGVLTCPIKKFINQPADGILYDLNRSEATVLTFTDDINDYAVAKVIRELKSRITELESKINSSNND